MTFTKTLEKAKRLNRSHCMKVPSGETIAHYGRSGWPRVISRYWYIPRGFSAKTYFRTCTWLPKQLFSFRSSPWSDHCDPSIASHLRKPAGRKSRGFESEPARWVSQAPHITVLYSLLSPHRSFRVRDLLMLWTPVNQLSRPRCSNAV
jgi:hypothetical protein